MKSCSRVLQESWSENSESSEMKMQINWYWWCRRGSMRGSTLKRFSVSISQCNINQTILKHIIEPNLHNEQSKNQHFKENQFIDFAQQLRRSSWAYKDAKMNIRLWIIYESLCRYTKRKWNQHDESKTISHTRVDGEKVKIKFSFMKIFRKQASKQASYRNPKHISPHAQSI